MTTTTPRLWHVACHDHAARRALLRRHPTLTPGAWWCVDLPAPDGPWLELSTAADPDTWRADARLFVPAPASVTLSPGTFPGGHVPEVMPIGLALGSARVAALLAARDDLAPHLAPELRRALEAVHPDPVIRRDAALWHALWLARATDHEHLLLADSLPGLLAALPADPPADDPAPSWSHPSSTLLNTGGPADDPVRIAAVARMLHIHAVRLLGPDHPDAIRRELAALIAVAAPDAR